MIPVVLMEFFVILCLFMFLYYLIPVSAAYYIFFVSKNTRWKNRRIQDRSPSIESIKREIKWSVLSIVIFSILASILYQFIKANRTQLYFEVDDYGIFYLCVSPLLAMFIHDTYYYWLHRAMHHKMLFKYFHCVHHKSKTPTPWAIYSFQPLEAIFTFFSFALLIFFLPLHPIALTLYLLISLITNIGGHIGHEIMPAWFVHKLFFKFSLPVTFHDLHHSSMKTNYGAYFNFWDRWMKTVHVEYEKTFGEVCSRDASKD